MNHCMAACHYLKQSRRGLAATFGNRFVSRIDSFPHRRHLSPADPVAPPSSLLAPFRRVVHASVYDKNLEELDTPAVVPDEVIQPQSEEYWAPHPKTGVFGPAEQDAVACGERGFHSSTINTTQDSVLEQKAFFRPLEDLEKPPPQP